MNVPLLDLKAQYAAIRPEVDAAIARVMESQQFILGPAVEECEVSRRSSLERTKADWSFGVVSP